MVQLNTRDQYRLLDVYDQGYWSGTDADFYIGNVHMTNMAQWNWVVSENVRPYYGYADYIPTKINHGARVIQGEMTLNLQNFSTFHRLINLLNNRDLENPDETLDKIKTKYQNDFKTVPVLTLDTNQAPKIDINTSAELAANYVRAFKNQRAFSSLGTDDTLTAGIPSNKGIWEVDKNKRFDVTLVFGGLVKDSLQLKYDHHSDGHELTNSDIKPKKSIWGSTGMKFIDVEFMSCATNVSDDGRPIMQTYQWFARDIQIIRANNFSE